MQKELYQHGVIKLGYGIPKFLPFLPTKPFSKTLPYHYRQKGIKHSRTASMAVRWNHGEPGRAHKLRGKRLSRPTLRWTTAACRHCPLIAVEPENLVFLDSPSQLWTPLIPAGKCRTSSCAYKASSQNHLIRYPRPFDEALRLCRTASPFMKDGVIRTN